LWAAAKEAYPRAEAIVREWPPAGATDWNDALRTAPERIEGQGQEDDRARAGPGVMVVTVATSAAAASCSTLRARDGQGYLSAA